MAAVGVTEQNTRINDMESLTVGQTISSIGGGAGSALEGTIFYQNANSIGRKITNTTATGAGFYSTTTATHDISTGSGTYQTVIYKYNVVTSPDLKLLSNPGLWLQIGSDASNYEEYDIHGSDTYPAKGGWGIIAIDPNIAGYVDDSTNGTPVLTAADYWGIKATFIAGGAKDLNVLLDAIDVGDGLTLVGGDGADTDGVFQDFVDYDEGTIANRFGYVTTNDIGLVVRGMLVIGSATATVFQDSDIVVAFADDRFAAGWSGITVGLNSATTDVDFADCTFIGKGNTTTTDTRPVLTVTGTSGAFNTTNCVFDNFATITLTSAATITGGKITNSNAITQASGTISGVAISGSTTADGVAFITSNDPSLISNCSFTFSDGHAIEITTAGTYDFTGNTFTDYGANGTTDAVIYNNSGGAVTLNIIGGDTPTVRNGTSATTTVNNSVNLTVTVKDINNTNIQNVACAIYKQAKDAMKGAVADDGGSQTDETTAANNATANDMTLLPATPVVGDAYYFGGADRFWQLEINIGQNGAGVWTIVWEYYDETTSWTDLSSYGLDDGTNGFRAGTGTKEVRFNPQTGTAPAKNWITTTVNGINAYWIRARVTAYTSITTQPLGTQSFVWAQLMNELSNVSGVATETFNYSTDTNIDIRIRKSSTGTTRYFPIATSGQITSAGFSLTAVVTQDDIASA